MDDAPLYAELIESTDAELIDDVHDCIELWKWNGRLWRAHMNDRRTTCCGVTAAEPEDYEFARQLGVQFTPCPTCKGSGKLFSGSPSPFFSTGRYETDVVTTCPECGGTGKVRESA